MMKYEKLTKLSIRNHAERSERWVQERIAEDPRKPAPPTPFGDFPSFRIRLTLDGSC